MEYKNENTGSLWLADKETKNGDKYYNGSIYIGTKEYKIAMFVNQSENPKAPKFRLKVNEITYEKPKTSDRQEENKNDPYKEFAELVEKNKDSFNEDAGF